MNKNKKIKITIISSLALICVISIAILILSIKSNNDLSQQIDEFYLKSGDATTISQTAINEYPLANNEPIEYTNYLASFRRDYVYEGIHFLTSVDKWNNARLEDVAVELFDNTHGDEMKYVEAVILDNYGGYRYSGTQSSSYFSYEIPISYFNLLPNQSILYRTYEKSILTIYGVEDLTLPEDIAQPLSKAYGYHYVGYYMDLDGTIADKNTEYYKVRADENDQIRLEISSQEDYQDYRDNYIWYLIEIAANDYMYLMGSDYAHRVLGIPRENIVNRTEFYEENDITIRYKWNFFSKNYIPHENIQLPFPDEVEGLEEYFYSFLEDSPPERVLSEVDVSLVNFRLRLDRNKWFVFEWDDPFKDEGAVYKVILYDEFGKMVAVRSENRSNVSTTPGYQMIYWTKYFRYYEVEDQTKIYARLSIAFPDGTTYLTDPLEAVLVDDLKE